VSVDLVGLEGDGRRFGLGWTTSQPDLVLSVVIGDGGSFRTVDGGGDIEAVGEDDRHLGCFRAGGDMEELLLFGEVWLVEVVVGDIWCLLVLCVLCVLTEVC